MRVLRLEREHVRQFAEASGDRNPLHVDEDFARCTPYGRCIAHGALAAIAALGNLDEQTLGHAQRIELQFKHPLFPGDEHQIAMAEDPDERRRIDVRRGGKAVATVAVTADTRGSRLGSVPKGRSASSAASPRVFSIEELSVEDAPLTVPFTPDIAALSELASELGAAHVPEVLLAWLSAASYTVGMLVPGRDALFAGGRLERSSTEVSGELTAGVSAVDDRTGFVAVDAVYRNDEFSAELTLQTFLRPAVPEPTRESLSRFLSPATEMTGQNVLVVGASRGLGASLAGALATQGATVWTAFARSAQHAARLKDEFGGDKIRLLQFDAVDPEESGRALEAVSAEVGTLNGIVLTAAPPLNNLPIHPDTLGTARAYLDSSLAMALVPLAAAFSSLASDGWIVFLSSSALEAPPEGWAPYVAAKGALEAVAAYYAAHSNARVLIVRAPRTWTESTNSPLGRIGAADKDQIAAAIVRGLLAPKESARPELLTAEELSAEGELIED